eukprot:TRINITY_DN3941_c0_g1_i1.p1 TRINITY_DN3941_c0_g1~~TRINITY_DN3941_c0_g1_i1.p1  ORF type:complete len:750 (-),score=306.61 TRINITY_DN3941_c0_g1_i1:63-2312(-)
MAKRGAGTELNHDNWDQEEEREDAGTFKKATDGDMKGRVIKRARRRNAGGEEGGEKKNVFSGFGGFAAKPDATQAFSFLSKPAEPEKPAGGGFVFGAAAGATAAKPAQASGFSFGSPSSGAAKPSFGAFGSDSKSDAPAPVFGAFSSDKSASSPATTTPLFGSKSDAAPAATFGGFAFGAKKDPTPEPAANVEDSPPPKSDFSAFKPAPGWSCSTCMVKNPLDQTSCLSCETPKPGTKPVEKAAPAPTFGSGGGFKFGGDSAAKPADSGAGGLFSFGAAASKPASSSENKDVGGGGFAFGAQAKGEKSPGPAFSFGSKVTAEKSETSGFSFGAKPDESTGNTSASSGFSFGSKSDSSSSKADSGFSFGGKPETAAEKPPASSFSFGVKSDSSSKPVGGGFSLGTRSASPEKQVATSFSAAKQTDTPSGVSKPSSCVNPSPSSSANIKDNTSGISTEYLSHLKALNIQVLAWLKQHIETNPLVILSPVFKDYDKHLAEITEQFDQKDASPAPEGSSSSATPVTIPDPAPKADPIPLGQAAFGAPKTSSSSSPFSFGVSDKPVNSTAPFSFGQSSQPPASSAFGSAGGFGAGGGFSFGTGGPGASTNTAETKPAAAAKEDQDEDQPPVVEVKQVEESDAIYDKKCKLFYKKDGNYVEKGVGMLYLKTVDGGKIQLLVRADTNLGNVLLNILLNPQIPTTRVGKNNVMLVCIPNPPVDPKADSSAPCPMLIRVKTGDDADELKAKLDELKEQ